MSAEIIRGPWPGTEYQPSILTRPPTAEYLAERERLGMPSNPEVINQACPYCGARELRPCRIRGSGTSIKGFHPARVERASESEGDS